MELTEDEMIRKYAKQCIYCNRSILLLFEYKWTCVACGFNVIKRKNEPAKIQG